MRGRAERWSAGQLVEADWRAGALVGGLVIAFHVPLTELYALPRALVLTLGWANLAYACGSFTLARLRRGDRVPLLGALAVANVAWAVLCGVLAVRWFGEASAFGLAQLAGEALFVGVLGLLEGRAARRGADP